MIRQGEMMFLEQFRKFREFREYLENYNSEGDFEEELFFTVVKYTCLSF